MLKPEAGLFERARNSPSARVLPRPDAPLDKLKQLGRVLCKAVLDEHPIGSATRESAQALAGDGPENEVIFMNHL